MLHIYTRGLIVPEQSSAIVSAFGIRTIEGHVAIRYSRILKDKYSDKTIDCLSILEVLKLIKEYRIKEPIVLWNTDKTGISYINGEKKTNNKSLKNIIEQINELLKDIGNIDVQWIQFENNLANLMINQTLLKNKTECFIREDINSLSCEQLIKKIQLLEKENLELQKEKQFYGIELDKRQVALKELKHQLLKNNNELNKYKEIVNRVTEEKMIAFALLLPPTPYIN